MIERTDFFSQREKRKKDLGGEWEELKKQKTSNKTPKKESPKKKDESAGKKPEV